MMMPANFSAVAENEMTYVVGGASLVDILAPVMTAENWQNVNYNLIQIVGNTFLQKNVNAAFTDIFSGNYRVGNVAKAAWSNLGKIWNNNYWVDGVVDGTEAKWGAANGLLNTGLQVVGTLASIYTLGSGKVGLKVENYSKV